MREATRGNLNWVYLSDRATEILESSEKIIDVVPYLTALTRLFELGHSFILECRAISFDLISREPINFDWFSRKSWDGIIRLDNNGLYNPPFIVTTNSKHREIQDLIPVGKVKLLKVGNDFFVVDHPAIDQSHYIRIRKADFIS